MACEQAAVGKRTTFIMPVGVEKRVELPISDLASFVNDCDSEGLRLYPATGTPYTELDALTDLFDVDAELIAAVPARICGRAEERAAGSSAKSAGEDIDSLVEYVKELERLQRLDCS